MYWPRPVRSRAMQAVRMPTAQYSPADRSATGTPHLAGSPPLSPVTLISPDIAWAMRS